MRIGIIGAGMVEERWSTASIRMIYSFMTLQEVPICRL